MSSNDECQLNHCRSGSRQGRRGGPPDPPSSSSRSSRTQSRNFSCSDWDKNCPPAPYSNYIPSVKTNIKLELLPAQDGNQNMAIEYFWKIQQPAAMKGYLPQALGYWLWMNPKEQQEYMRSHYVIYMRGIKEGLLGHTWQMHFSHPFLGTYEVHQFLDLGYLVPIPGW